MLVTRKEKEKLKADIKRKVIKDKKDETDRED